MFFFDTSRSSVSIVISLVISFFAAVTQFKQVNDFSSILVDLQLGHVFCDSATSLHDRHLIQL